MMNRVFFIALLFLSAITQAQYNSERPKDAKKAYFREEETLHDGKRYRIHNNYISGGIGILGSDLRERSQVNSGIDFVFHIRRQHFELGGYVSGATFGYNNHLQAHFCYGYRKETTTYNFAIFGGPALNKGVVGVSDPALGTVPVLYDKFSFYGNVQLVYKLKYDIGIGGEAFTEIAPNQLVGGLRVILFFSGSFRGNKKNFNPNVRSQRK